MAEAKIRVLAVEDNAEDFLILQTHLAKSALKSYVLEQARSLAEGLRELALERHDAYLVDFRLGPDTGFDFLQTAAALPDAPPVILLTGQGDPAVDMEAMRLGAADYLAKADLTPDLLDRAIRYALAQKKIRSELSQRTFLLESVLENMGEGVVMVDARGKLMFINPAGERIIGEKESGPNGDWVKASGVFLPDGITPFPHEERPLSRALRGEMVDNVEMVVSNERTGGNVFLIVSARPLKESPGSQAGGAVMVFRDVTPLKMAEQKILHHTLFSPITRLPNRVLFLERMGQALKRQQRDSRDYFAVLYLHVKGVRKISQALGPDAEVLLLRESARRLEHSVARGDTAAHLGGSEFAVLLGGSLSPEEADRSGKAIIEIFRTHFRFEGHEVFLSATAGLVADSRAYGKGEEMLRDAYQALNWARYRSKNPIEFYDSAMRTGSVENLTLETDLRHALEKKEFKVFYQPVVSLKNGKLEGFEALLRWEHPKKGMVSPAQFIPLAEETGLILPIGDWVLREACRQRREWLEKYPKADHLSVSVNMSAKQFLGKDMAAFVLSSLKDHGLRPEHINLEITESVMVENFDAASAVLGQLKKNRLSLHLDDFGTGYSSLSQLHRFPLDVLKIDQSFVRRMTPTDTGIVRTIITLADELGMGVIAEGVETLEQAVILRSLNCPAAQGYYYAKPLPPTSAEALFSSALPWTATS